MDPAGPWGTFMDLLRAHEVPQLVLFELALDAEDEGALCDVARLTSMPARDVAALQLYPLGGVAGIPANSAHNQ